MYPTPYPPYTPPPPRRSAIPKVIGIVAIVFAPIGLGLSALFLFGPLSDMSRWDHAHRWGAETAWLYGWGVLSLFLFGLHLTAGILSVRCAPSAPRIVLMYAIGAIALAVIDVPLLFALAPHANGGRDLDIRESVIYPRLVFDVLALVWPTIALPLMMSRGAKAACGLPLAKLPKAQILS